MIITSYQIRNVLRTYGNQLKRRANFPQESVAPVQPSSDLVDISVEARKKQVLNQLSEKLIAKVTSRGQGDDAPDGLDRRTGEDQKEIMSEVFGE